MAFIKVQKLVRDSNNRIVSGSASIVESVYVPGKKNHSTQRVRERLGKVISLSEDKKSGVFLSPARGLVEFDAVSGTFSPVSDTAKETSYSELFPKPQIHTVFGDVFLLLRFLEKHGLLVFQSVFPKKRNINFKKGYINHSGL